MLGLQHLGLGRLQRVIETAQHGERQDDLLELAFPESAVEQIGNRPEEADDVVEFGGFVHGMSGAAGRRILDGIFMMTSRKAVLQRRTLGINRCRRRQ